MYFQASERHARALDTSGSGWQNDLRSNLRKPPINPPSRHPPVSRIQARSQSVSPRGPTRANDETNSRKCDTEMITQSTISEKHIRWELQDFSRLRALIQASLNVAKDPDNVSDSDEDGDDYVVSAPIGEDEYQWTLQLFPYGPPNNRGHVGLYLQPLTLAAARLPCIGTFALIDKKGRLVEGTSVSQPIPPIDNQTLISIAGETSAANRVNGLPRTGFPRYLNVSNQECLDKFITERMDGSFRLDATVEWKRPSGDAGPSSAMMWSGHSGSLMGEDVKTYLLSLVPNNTTVYDMAFYVGEETEPYPACSLLVACRASKIRPFIEQAWSAPDKTSRPITLRVDDASSESGRALLQFIHTDSCTYLEREPTLGTGPLKEWVVKGLDIFKIALGTGTSSMVTRIIELWKSHLRSKEIGPRLRKCFNDILDICPPQCEMQRYLEELVDTH